MWPSLFAALALTAGPAPQQEGARVDRLSFPVVLAAARARNPDLLAYEREVQAGLERAGAEAAFPDPELGFFVHDLPVPSFSFREDMMTMAGAELRLRLPWFGKRDLDRRAAETDARAVSALQDAHALGLTDAVARAYAELWLARRTRDLVALQMDALDRLVRTAQRSFAVGEGAHAELLLVEAERSGLAEILLRLESQEAGARARLGAAVAAGGPLRGEPEDPELFELPPIGELFDSLERHPELVALRHRKESLLLRARRARKEKLPDPNVSFSYGVRISHPDMVGVGVGFPIPLFGAGRAERLAAAAEAEAQAIERRIAARRDALAAEIRAAHAAAKAEIERYRLYAEEILPRAEQSARAAAVAFTAGRGSLFSVVERERDVLARREQMLAARAAAFVSLVHLLSLAGDERRLAGGES